MKKLLITVASLFLLLALSTGIGAIYAGSLYFDDLTESDWACKIADEVYLSGYMFGVGDREFAPKREVTYAELVTVLYRLAGTPKVTDSSTGVHKWYHLEMLWGESVGIIDPAVNHPESIASRDDIVRIIYRLAVHQGIDTDTSDDFAVLDRFLDSDTLPDDSKAQWSFAINENIIKGNGSAYLMPNGSLTREQLSAIVLRLVPMLAKNRPESELWNIPAGETVFSEAPYNGNEVLFSVDRINNRYLIENEDGEYICTTYGVNRCEKTEINYTGECPYVYGTIPCYEAVYYVFIPFPEYFFVIPDSESFTVTPMYSDTVNFSFNGFDLEGYGIETVTFEGETVTIYGRRATLTDSNADTCGYTVIFADK